MKTKLITNMYDFECKLLRHINSYFDHKFLNIYFRNVTHFGGALVTISTSLLIILSSRGFVQAVGIASALSLLISHLPVAIVKRLYPRKRPYITHAETKVPSNPLVDHSFPSGHTTAIFSIIIPYILYIPQLAIILLPIAISVGFSRVYLGLHYPSDVFAGSIIGSSSGILCYLFVKNFSELLRIFS